MNRGNAEITKLGIGIKSIIKDYTKIRDWELEILVNKGYEGAIKEKQQRNLLSQIVRSNNEG